ncbi:vacuolar ATP synthase subunit S1-domain-containing protein [Lipomyces oligophaga]|uniref:vacuolar ATP synthase subunit S1-domain-containing protein n=1 Tax=Lipomyces oligophaga TaxID=45792 RepID=UPI0034CD113A
MLFASAAKGAVLALAASLTAVQAFEDTSPLMLLASQMIPSVHEQMSGASIVSASHFQDLAHKMVSDHKADAYVVVSQPGLHASDFSAVGQEQKTPNLRSLYEKAATAYAIRNAHGNFDVDLLEKHIVDTWGADTLVVDSASDASAQVKPTSEKTQVVRVEFPALPNDLSRSNALVDNDVFLASILSLLNSENIAIVYSSTPIARPYVAKRNTATEEDVTPSYVDELIGTLPDGTIVYPTSTGTGYPTMIPEGARTDGSIFTRYQFFTAGLFMSIIAAIVLLAILGVGLKSIASIKISYEAFEKDMGPQNFAAPQKK